jgi:septal ring-binding cell division protein DamX
MEKWEENVKGSAARRRIRDSWRGIEVDQSSAEKNTRKFFYIAAGSIVVALVAFLCGVQMGKSLSELQRSDNLTSRVQDQKGQAPPFRLMGKGKETHPTQEAKVLRSDPGENLAEKERDIFQASPKVVNGKNTGDSIPQTAEEERDMPPKGKYTLQVAAFNNAAEAQELVDRLKKKGYDVYQVTGNAAAKGTLQRVRIGHFQSLQEARQFALTFEKRENVRPIIATVQNP